MKLTHLFALAIAAMLFVGCDERPRHHHHKRPTLPEKEAVNIYRTHRTNGIPLSQIASSAQQAAHVASSTINNDDWIYWYIIYDSNTRTYYSASSPTLTTTYSSLSWSKSSELPALKESEVEPLDQQEVSTAELGEASAEISSGYAAIPEENSLDSMEGVDSNDSVDSTSDSSGADSSSGDSGGGDAGGGDGGGGGE